MGRTLAIWLAVTSLGLLAVRLLFIGTTMLIDDEAYYAMYARHLDFGYIDHGPVVGYVIRACTALFGENGFGVRFFGVLAITVMGAVLYAFGRRCFSKTTGAVLSLCVTVNMLTHTNAVVMTPDVPMAFFAILGIACYYLAFFVDRKYLLLAGLLAGIAALSKITAALPFIGIFLYPFFDGRQRQMLKEPRFYMSFAIAVLAFLPFIIWNYQNDFAFVRYQGAHASRSGNISSFFELWGALVFLVGPPAFVYAVGIPLRNLITRRTQRPPWQTFFAAATLVPLLFFIAQSLFARLEINWPAPVFYGGLFLFGIAVGESWPQRRRWFNLQMILSIALITVITVQVYFPFLPMEHGKDPTGRYFEYTALKSDFAQLLEAKPELRALRIAGNNYQMPSMVNMYATPPLAATCLSIDYHDTMYGYYYPDEALVGQDLLFVISRDKFPGHLRPYFGEITREALLQSKRSGVAVNNITVWRARGYKGRTHRPQ